MNHDLLLIKKLSVGALGLFFISIAYAAKTTRIHTASEKIPPPVKLEVEKASEYFEQYPLAEQYRICLSSIEQSLIDKIHKLAKDGERVGEISKSFYEVFSGVGSDSSVRPYVFLDNNNGLITLNTLEEGSGESPEIYLVSRKLIETSTAATKWQLPPVALTPWEKSQAPRFMNPMALNNKEIPAMDSVLAPKEDGQIVSLNDQKGSSVSLLNRAVDRGSELLKKVNKDLPEHCVRLRENLKKNALPI